MNKFLITLIIAFGMVVNVRGQIEKTIGEFSEVKVFDLINVTMIKSSENKVVINGNNRRDVQVINKNGKLKIRMKLEESYNGNDTEVTLYYTKVDIIDANEGAIIKVKDVIDQFDIKLKTQEGGEITAQLKTKYADLRAVTGGIINLIGTSKSQDISIYTGGVYNGKDLVTKDTEVSINAAGEAYINATEFAEVRVRAGGDVYIYGDPKKVDEKRVLGGRIKRM